MKAIRIHQYGGPEVLTYEETPDPSPGPGEALSLREGTPPESWFSYPRGYPFEASVPCITVMPYDRFIYIKGGLECKRIQ